jgi:DNA-binding response OmpR family regulator
LLVQAEGRFLGDSLFPQGEALIHACLSRRFGVSSTASEPETTVQYLFQEQVLDTDRRELRRGAERIAIGPQVFDLLVYLLRNREHVVSKDDLLDSVRSRGCSAC